MQDDTTRGGAELEEAVLDDLVQEAVVGVVLVSKQAIEGVCVHLSLEALVLDELA